MFNSHPKGANMSEYVLRLPEVKKRTGLSRSTIYAAVRLGTFPVPISLGERAVGWLESSISAWIDDRVKVTNGAAKEGA